MLRYEYWTLRYATSCMTSGETEPASTQARSLIDVMRKNYCDFLRIEELRPAFDGAVEQITGLFSARDVPITQDSMAGFVNGFMHTCTQFEVPEQEKELDGTMIIVLGGVCMLTAHSPLSCTPGEREAIYDSSFWDLGGNPPLDDPAHPAREQEIRDIFRVSPDVPVNTESLAGLMAGVAYALYHVEADICWTRDLILTARHIALNCPPEPDTDLLLSHLNRGGPWVRTASGRSIWHGTDRRVGRHRSSRRLSSKSATRRMGDRRASPAWPLMK